MNAAEDVRVASNEYIDVIEQLKKEVEASNAQIDELQGTGIEACFTS